MIHEFHFDQYTIKLTSFPMGAHGYGPVTKPEYAAFSPFVVDVSPRDSSMASKILVKRLTTGPKPKAKG